MKRAVSGIRRFLSVALVFISVIQLSVFVGVNQASASMPSGGLLLDLRANGTSSFPGNTTTWNDQSGNSNNATLQGSPTWSTSLGGSFTMDGTDHFTLPAGFSDFRSGITISVHANFGSNSGTRVWERLIDFGGGAQSNNILFARVGDTNDLAIEVYDGATSRGLCRWNNAILDNTWATYAVTLDGTTCLIFRDGSWGLSTAYSYLPSFVSRTSNFIGRSNWGTDAYFDNGIADVAIYSRALSTTEVATVSTIQKDSTAPTITGPSSATGSTSSISIQENTTSVHTFTANETVSWSRSGTDSSFFSITTGGVLSITSRNFESPTDADLNNTYVVIITATDLAGYTKSQTLTVTITNVNEAPSITNSSSDPTATLTQAENISSVATFAATDPDAGAVLRFSISGTDAADFSIDSVTGVLAFAANPDFEAPLDSDTNNTYVVAITVSDGSLTDLQTLTVTITNANESSTVGAPTFSAATVKGVTLTISITSSVAGRARFFVNGKRIPSCLSRPASGSYPNFTVTCSWKPPVTGRQNVSASFTPTDNTFSATNSPTTVTWVSKRSTTR
jgi:Concanavalin A-like lectin/glucanases superfamily/Cadherin domain